MSPQPKPILLNLVDFGVEEAPSPVNHHVLLSIKHKWYQLLRTGQKSYEFRKVYRCEPSTAFIYVSSPVCAVSALAELGQPIVRSSQELAAIAEEDCQGTYDSILQYFTGKEEGYAIPVHSLVEIEPITLGELRRVLAGFSPPQSYLMLKNHPRLFTYLASRLQVTT